MNDLKAMGGKARDERSDRGLKRVLPGKSGEIISKWTIWEHCLEKQKSIQSLWRIMDGWRDEKEEIACRNEKSEPLCYLHDLCRNLGMKFQC